MEGVAGGWRVTDRPQVKAVVADSGLCPRRYSGPRPTLPPTCVTVAGARIGGKTITTLW